MHSLYGYIQYEGGAGKTSENSLPLPNLNVLDAVSKDMQAILLCSNKMP